MFSKCTLNEAGVTAVWLLWDRLIFCCFNVYDMLNNDTQSNRPFESRLIVLVCWFGGKKEVLFLQTEVVRITVKQELLFCGTCRSKTYASPFVYNVSCYIIHVQFKWISYSLISVCVCVCVVHNLLEFIILYFLYYKSIIFQVKSIFKIHTHTQYMCIYIYIYIYIYTYMHTYIYCSS